MSTTEVLAKGIIVRQWNPDANDGAGEESMVVMTIRDIIKNSSGIHVDDVNNAMRIFLGAVIDFLDMETAKNGQ